jgi:hypothetical protein
MTEKFAYKEKDILITHKISVDFCIADEIKKLNNENCISTLSSCCGHGDAGYIIVGGSDIEEMLKLGYKMTTAKYLDNDIMINDRIVTCAFKPLSICKCIVIGK